MNHLRETWKTDKLLAAVLVSWYVTVISIFGDTYFLQIPLPIGGHFFLFRGVLPLTVLLYGIWCIRRKHNPFAGLSRLEQCIFLTFGIMMVYGTVSVFFAISKGAWFAKYLTMGMYFCFTFLYMALCKERSVKRSTVLLCTAGVLFCTVGGILELFCDSFFANPYSGAFNYYFFNKFLQAPIFTFYNQNSFTAFMLWELLILWLYLFDHWPQLTEQRRSWLLWALSVLTYVNIFLAFVANGRLCIWASALLFVGIFLWLLLRWKRGLAVFLLFACCFLFIYVGENYDYTKSMAAYTVEKIQYDWKQLTTYPEPPVEAPPAKPEFKVNTHGTLSWLVPTDKGTGSVSISSDQSGSTRIQLLKASLDMLLKSKGLGIGLGNAELRMVEYDNPEHAVNIHCFIMELFLEFGIFAILPLGLVACALLWHWLQVLLAAVRGKDRVLLSDLLFQICTVATYPLLSTANSSSWGIGAMWLFLGYVAADSSKKQMKIRGSAENNP